MRRLKFHCVLVAIGCAAPLTARAQTTSSTPMAALAAESAFLEGVRLMKQDDCAHAVPRFEESERLDPASGTLLNLAYCQAHVGKTASAWLTYRHAIALAERTGKQAHAQMAREQGAKLEPLLPKLRFLVVGESSRITHLKLDDEELVQETWNLSVPVDPGPHRVGAVFDTGERWETEVSTQPGQQSVVEVTVPHAEVVMAVPVVAPPLAVARSEKSRPASAALPAVPAAGAPPPRPLGWALGLGLTGAGAIVAGGALFVSARVGYDAARSHCSANNACSEPYYDREQAATTRATLSYVLAGSGVLLVGAAAVLQFQASHDDKPRAQVSVLVLGPRDFGAAYARPF